MYCSEAALSRHALGVMVYRVDGRNRGEVIKTVIHELWYKQ